MWIDEGNSFRMISAAPDDIRIEMVSGSAVVASGTLPKRSKLTLLLNRPAQLKVLSGRATVQWSNHTSPVATGRWLSLDALARVRSFDRHNPDPLENWSSSRAALLRRAAGNPPECNVQQPESDRERVDPDRARTVFRNKRINPSTTMPVENPAAQPRPLGCGVGPW